ncbi:hypothetical protein M9434_005902 [Picochlorum sp. BPE23]|nr:hypothetical protein M9434_005902 [Picochlorum sp. BPE23]
MVKAISKKSKGDCHPVDDASLGRGKSHQPQCMDGMVTTPDAQSGSKVVLGSSMNRYRQCVRGEIVQSRILMPHSGQGGQFEVGAECDCSNKDDTKTVGERARLSGPVCVESMSKEGSRKKEDKWLLKPSNSWSCVGGDGEEGSIRTNVGAWGVFDGHGGRQVATYASHALIKYVAEHCASPSEAEAVSQEDEVSDGDSYDSYVSPRVLGGGEHGGVEEGEIEEVFKQEGCMEEWSVQYELMKRLPRAVQKAFLKCDEMACKQFSHGGTTATVALVCGWQLLVANVGDSCAYFDTGSEVLAVSGNHRLEDNADEVKRIEESGGEVEPSSIDGKPAGPIRVWPGGLAMSRTIGDVDAGDLCAARAEVAQMTIPKDGGRLFIASDGLWDAVHYKTAAHHTRDMTASEASHKLLSMAIKKDHLKDDVTILVIDFMPSEECRIPLGLHLHRPAPGKKGKGKPVCIEKLASVWHPLDDTRNTKWIEEELQRRVETIREMRIHEEEEKYIKERQMEMEEEERKRIEEQHSEGSSSLLDELAGLTLSPDDFRENDEWETVKPTSPTAQKQQQKKKNYARKNSRQRKKSKEKTEEMQLQNNDDQASKTQNMGKEKKQKKTVKPQQQRRMQKVKGEQQQEALARGGIAPPPPPPPQTAGLNTHIKNENSSKKQDFKKRNTKKTIRNTATLKHQESDTVLEGQSTAEGGVPQKKPFKRPFYRKKNSKNVNGHSSAPHAAVGGK